MLVSGVLAVACAAAGCGTGTDRRQVGETAQAYVAAVAHGDARAVCAQLSAAAAAAVAEQEGERTCESAVPGAGLHGGRLGSVSVFAQAAQVDLTGGATLFLARGHDGWRITAAGCRGSGDRPLDCEIEA